MGFTLDGIDMQDRKKLELAQKGHALPGRSTPVLGSGTHFVKGNSLVGPFPNGLDKALFGLGCFWGAEKVFWPLEGIYSTAVGYAGGHTPNPTYEEVCSGLTGHNEVVLVVFASKVVQYSRLLQLFWQKHNPTQGMRQGNDIGTQYRSAIFTYTAKQKQQAYSSLQLYQQALDRAGYGAITTEISDAPEFYYAEDYHQQYLAKNPAGYCGLGGTGIACEII